MESASAFFFRSLYPRWAPINRFLICARTVTVGTTVNLFVVDICIVCQVVRFICLIQDVFVSVYYDVQLINYLRKSGSFLVFLKEFSFLFSFLFWNSLRYLFFTFCVQSKHDSNEETKNRR